MVDRDNGNHHLDAVAVDFHDSGPVWLWMNVGVLQSWPYCHLNG
jgi:hypothetical protein